MSNCACAGMGSGSGPHWTQISPEGARNRPGALRTPGPASIAVHPVKESAGLMQMSAPVTTVGPMLLTTGVAPRMAQPPAAPSGTTAPPPAPPLPPGRESASPQPTLKMTRENAMRDTRAKNFKLVDERMRVFSLEFGALNFALNY